MDAVGCPRAINKLPMAPGHEFGEYCVARKVYESQLVVSRGGLLEGVEANVNAEEFDSVFSDIQACSQCVHYDVYMCSLCMSIWGHVHVRRFPLGFRWACYKRWYSFIIEDDAICGWCLICFFCGHFRDRVGADFVQIGHRLCDFAQIGCGILGGLWNARSVASL